VGEMKMIPISTFIFGYDRLELAWFVDMEKPVVIFI